MLGNWRTRNFLVTMVFLQSMIFATVFLDVPIARQVVGFVYFTFVPGFIIVKLLKLGQLSGLETILFSVGFSIAFLMLAGLLTNELGPLLGISEPLSLMPLMMILNSLLLVGGVLTHLRNGGFRLWSRKGNKASLFGPLFLFLPILSIIGARCVTANGNNLILLGMMTAIPLLFVIAVVSKSLLSQSVYPWVVFMIAIALLFHSSLISNYLLHFGSDVGGEYFAFKTTEMNAYWNSTNPYVGGEWVAYGRVHSMLSVTILPTMYSVLLNMDPIWIFKTIFPIIFSFVPLGLFTVWQMSFEKKYAFISAFLFMSLSTFYTEMLGLNKQILAEFFLVLLLLVVLKKKMKPDKKMICFIIFSFAMIVSHYALSEIFLILISFTLVSLIVLRRPAANLTVSMVVFFFVVMFLWYMYTSGSAVFQSFLDFGGHVYGQLGDFFSPTARGETVLRGLGLEASPTIWNMISRGFAYATQAFITIGFVGFIKKRTGFQRELVALTSLSMALLAALLVVPGLAETLNMYRFYHILLFFLAPLCVLGGETVANLVSKRRIEMMTAVLLLMVLTPYFLFQTGFVYEVTGSDSWSISLSKYRMSPLRSKGLLGDSDACSVFGAEWLAKNTNVEHGQIYADFHSDYQLRIYGVLYRGYGEFLSNTTKVKPNGTVYLSSLNVCEEIVFDSASWHNLSELTFLSDLNKIYSNGGSEAYKNTP